MDGWMDGRTDGLSSSTDQEREKREKEGHKTHKQQHEYIQQENLSPTQHEQKQEEREQLPGQAGIITVYTHLSGGRTRR